MDNLLASQSGALPCASVPVTCQLVTQPQSPAPRCFHALRKPEPRRPHTSTKRIGGGNHDRESCCGLRNERVSDD